MAHPEGYVRAYRERKPGAGLFQESDWPGPHWYTDAAFASLLIILTAIDEGLGAFYFSIGSHAWSIPPFKSAFGIRAEYEPMGVIAVGHPSPDAPPPTRGGQKHQSKVMHFGSW